MPLQQQLVDPFGTGTAQLKTQAGYVLDGVVIRSSTALRRGVEPDTIIGRKPQQFSGPLNEIHAKGNNFEPATPVTIEVTFVKDGAHGAA